MIQIENVLTLQEVADYLKIPENQIEKQVLQGKIPCSILFTVMLINRAFRMP